MRMPARTRALVLCALVAAGCGKKASQPSGPPPELTGLAAVPASAEVVAGADVAKLASAPIVERAVDQLLLHDLGLRERWAKLRDDCKLDVARQVKRVMLAIGPAPAAAQGERVGTGPVIMVVVGDVHEDALKDCVTKMVGQGGGSVTGKPIGGRTLYLAKDGNRTMYFGYGRPDTVVLGSSEAYVTEALGAGKKATDNPDLTRWMKRIDPSLALWAVGRIDPRVGDGLVRVTSGKLAHGPVAVAAMADLADGAKLTLNAIMATTADAKSLESYVKGELALLTAAAQLKSLGAVVAKVAVSVDDDVVQFRAPLTVDDLNQLLSALDGGGTSAQDSAPATPGSGSGTK
jgi:hypothetical protein